MERPRADGSEMQRRAGEVTGMDRKGSNAIIGIAKERRGLDWTGEDGTTKERP